MLATCPAHLPHVYSILSIKNLLVVIGTNYEASHYEHFFKLVLFALSKRFLSDFIEELEESK